MRLPRVYPILDTTLLDRLGLPLLDAAEALAEGGAQIIQLRHKSDYTREFYLAAKKLAELLKQANIALIINDRCCGFACGHKISEVFQFR